MDRDFELLFVSEDSLKLHLEYLNDLKLKYSVLEKQYPELSYDVATVKRARIDKAVKERALDLICNIKSHECYFNSFCEAPRPYKPIKRYFSSEDAFVYEIFLAARGGSHNFIYVCKNKSGKPFITDEYYEDPIFAIDTSEHAYFLDYGFSRDEYLRRALGYLKLEKLSLEALDKAEEK